MLSFSTWSLVQYKVIYPNITISKNILISHGHGLPYTYCFIDRLPLKGTICSSMLRFLSLIKLLYCFLIKSYNGWTFMNLFIHFVVSSIFTPVDSPLTLDKIMSCLILNCWIHYEKHEKLYPWVLLNSLLSLVKSVH